jgi:cytochrome b6-f complex iron-sulfur subunit
MTVKAEEKRYALEAEATQPSRRRLLQWLLGAGLLASAASFIYPLIKYLAPPAALDLGADTVVAANAKELAPNSGKIFRFGNKTGLLIREASGEYRAVSATCTHLSCTVQYRPENREIWCACHNGKYDLNGRNVSGPPPRPLEAFDVHVKGDDIVVSRKREA